MTRPPFFAIRRRMENSSNSCCGACGSWWRLPLVLGLVLAGMLAWRSASMRESVPPAGNQTAAGSLDASQEHVSLVVDFGGGKQRKFDKLPWHAGMTVADLVGEATGIEVTQQGTGQGALVTAIDGIASEGQDKSNWTYEVNGKSGDRSYAIYELHPDDRVLWTFGPQR